MSLSDLENDDMWYCNDCNENIKLCKCDDESHEDSVDIAPIEVIVDGNFIDIVSEK